MGIVPAPIRIRDITDLFQRDAKQAVDALAAIPILDGVLLEDVELSATAKRVYHNLGRTVNGFWVVWSDADSRVWVDGLNTSAFIELAANASVTVNLWVF